MVNNKIKGMSKQSRRTDKDNFYLTNEMIYEEWLKWKNSAAEVENRQVTDQLGIYIVEIASKITQTNSFSRYPVELKQDMVSEAILKCMKNLKNLREDKKDSFFNYLTRCCYCAFYGVLSKHYRHLNLRRELMKRAIDELELQTGCHDQCVKLKRRLESEEQHACADF